MNLDLLIFRTKYKERTRRQEPLDEFEQYFADYLGRVVDFAKNGKAKK